MAKQSKKVTQTKHSTSPSQGQGAYVSALTTTILSLFHFLVLTVPLFFSFKTSELFEFNKMILVYVITILITSSWFFKMTLEKKVTIKRTYLDIPILLFLVSQMLSTLFSIHPYTSLFGYYSRFHGGLLSSLTYIALYYAAVNNLTKKVISKLLVTLFAGSMLVSIYAILEHFGYSFSCYLSSSGETFDANCWIQDVQNRVFATFGQPNWLAAYAITLIPVGVHQFLHSNTPKTKTFYSCSTFLLLLALLYTKSRSGFLGFFISLILLLGYIFFFQKNSQRTLLYPAIAVLVITVAVIGTPFTPQVLPVTSHPTTNKAPTQPTVNRLDIGGTDSGEIRTIVWKGALSVWKRYPILGSGLETFAYSYYLDRPNEHNHVSEWDFLYNKAHNEILNIAANSGIVGLLAYLILLGSFTFKIVKQTFNKNNIASRDTTFLVALLSGVVALTASNFFGFSTVAVTVLLFLYFGFSALYTDDNDHISIQISPVIQKVLYILIGLMSLLLVNNVSKYREADIQFTTGKALYSAGQYLPALQTLHSAINLSPGQAEFYSELATKYAELAVQVAPTDSTASAELIPQAITFSDAALTLNPVHLNFYKDRSRVFILLSQLDPIYLQQAKTTLIQARKLSPTDPKLVYHLALLEHDLGNIEESLALLEQAVEMKPNYEQARFELATQYEAKDEIEKAIEQHQYILDHIAENQLSIEKIEQLQSKIPSNQ